MALVLTQSLSPFQARDPILQARDPKEAHRKMSRASLASQD